MWVGGSGTLADVREQAPSTVDQKPTYSTGTAFDYIFDVFLMGIYCVLLIINLHERGRLECHDECH